MMSILTRLNIVVLSGLVATLGIVGEAAANDGTPSWIHELIQEGSNVTATLAIVETGEPGLPHEFNLERQGPEGQVAVMEKKKFEAADALWSEGQCRGSIDPEYCATNPDECEDCDEDGVLECDLMGDGWCNTIFFFDVIDWCVPPGETSYWLHAEGWDSGWSDDEESITVEEWSGECEAPDSDSATGCSVSGLGASDSSPWSFVLLGLGAFALAARAARRPKGR